MYVASLENDSTVLGFYTLSACRIDVGELPVELSKKLPHYPYVPALLIGRLAISQDFHNKGLGKLLLMDALFKFLHDNAGGMAVIVNAKTIHAKAFYKKYGFVEFPDQHNKLFLRPRQIKLLF